jgi:DNA helicase MCM8
MVVPHVPPEALLEAWRLSWLEDEVPAPGEQRLVLTLSLFSALRGEVCAGGLLEGVDFLRARSFYFLFGTFAARVRAVAPTLAELDDAFRTFPDVVLRCAAAALCLVRSESCARPAGGAPFPPLAARFLGVTPLDSFASIDSQTVNRFVSIRGHVLRSTPVRPLLVAAEFLCEACGGEQRVHLVHGKFDAPQKCAAHPCRGTKFAVNHARAVTVDWQQLDVQELDVDAAAAEGAGGGGGGSGGGAAAAAPRSGALRVIKVELQGELVDRCQPGDLVAVGGIVQAIELDSAQGRGIGRNKLVFASFVEANSIVATKPDEREPAALRHALLSLCGGGGGGGGGGGAPRAPPAADTLRFFTATDLEGIRRVRAQKSPAALIVASTVPSIFGLEVVKLGLLLGLLGGTEEGAAAAAPGGGGGAPAAPAAPVRAAVHVLLVGDPGLGKSQLLRGVAALAPRHVFVTGGFESSAVGLTASVAAGGARGGGATLNAGALALADRGVCAIDELDKMAADHPALLEAMEQQRVTVAKAGAVSWLPARAAVLAAANPGGGRFDPYRSVCENLKMAPALLSRFDLIFIIVDTQDRARDESLAAHIVGAAGSPGGALKRPKMGVAGDAEEEAALLEEMFGGGAAGGGGAPPPPPPRAPALLPPRLPAPGASPPLSARLAAAVAALPPRARLPPPLLKKYLAFARRYCHPLLTPEAALVLRDFYGRLRAEFGRVEEGVPVTTRQLESLVRLAQARARLELRDWVTRADASEVCELLREALWDAAAAGEGGGELPRKAGGGGRANSEAGRVKAFVAQLQAEAKGSARREWRRADLLSLAQNMCGAGTTAADFLEKVHAQGYLLFASGCYRLA